MNSGMPDMLLLRLGTFIEERMGLHFLPERRADLLRGLRDAAPDFGCDSATACAERLMAAPLCTRELELLSSHLTVGETYFFRDKSTLDALEWQWLPALVAARRHAGRRLRLWSAGCCTGEEPYSLAIMLHRALPDPAEWNVTILGTDINPRFLRKAVAAEFGEWSFRELPACFREAYFTPIGDRRYALRPEIRRMVRFTHLNLAEDIYPSLLNDTNAMDLILCRNVLMYFTPAHAARVVKRLNLCLVDEGCLLLGPGETAHLPPGEFDPVHVGASMLLRKRHAPCVAPPAETPPARGGPSAAAPPSGNPCGAAESLRSQGRYADAIRMAAPAASGEHPEPRAVALTARAFADEGRLPEALDWCSRLIAIDRLNPAGHYLRATILEEQGDAARAIDALKRALYLDPSFVLAHFMLGNLCRQQGQPAQAVRNYRHTLALLAKLRPGELLPEAEGMSAGRLAEIIASLMESGVAA